MDDQLAKTTDAIKAQSQIIEDLRSEINKILIGQEDLLNKMLIALITNGHILLEGVPGLAKTTAVKTMAAVLGIDFQRISFTPDLLPADIIGTMIYNPREGEFFPKKGPVFTNMLLADEINRAPAKVQSALLEAMQEKQVTIGEVTYPLPSPFMVMATQNPIEQEGTYPLPEAQVDRFMLKCKVSYPSKEDEKRIMLRFGNSMPAAPKQILTLEQLQSMRQLFEQVYCDEQVVEYILDIVFATRNPADYGIAIDHQLEYGGSPRASLYLQSAARAHAMLQGRGYTTPQDVKAIAYDVLRHRVILTYEAEAENLTSDDIIHHILNEIPVP